LRQLQKLTIGRMPAMRPRGRTLLADGTGSGTYDGL